MRFPRIAELGKDTEGWGFFLCARKDVRAHRSGAEYLDVVLQDVTGEVHGKVLQNVDTLREEFDAGEFVKVQGRTQIFHGQLEVVVEKIRRVHASQDAADGFREADCIPTSPRPLDDMWRELEGRIASVEHAPLRALLTKIVAANADRLRIWPAALQVHHAYRGGLLEHVLAIMEIVVFLADRYGARKDLLIAGALLHDIGKLRELHYEVATEYSVEGNLIGHITLGTHMLRDAARDVPDLDPELVMELQHLILSHHGELEHGSPVKPMTVEAFILAAADDLDASLHQVRRHLEGDDAEGRFTSFHRRLDRALFKSSG